MNLTNQKLPCPTIRNTKPWPLAELEKQNEYSRKQLGNDIKQKQKALDGPIASVYDEDEANNISSSSSEEEPLRRVRDARGMPQNSNDFKAQILEFEGNWIQMNSWNGYTLWNNFLIIKTFQIHESEFGCT